MQFKYADKALPIDEVERPRDCEALTTGAMSFALSARRRTRRWRLQ